MTDLDIVEDTEFAEADRELDDRFEAYNAPAHWASYLVNGDASGLEADDLAECDAWLAREADGLPMFYCVDCADEFVGRFNGVLTDMATYTFQVRQ